MAGFLSPGLAGAKNCLREAYLLTHRPGQNLNIPLSSSLLAIWTGHMEARPYFYWRLCLASEYLLDAVQESNLHIW